MVLNRLLKNIVGRAELMILACLRLSNSDQSQDSVGSQKTHYPNNIAFFDYLISHGDRTGSHNWGYAPDGVPVLFDNADAFQKKQPMIFSTHIKHFIPDKSILANARKLDMEKLKDIDELSKEQKEDFLARRDKLIGLIDRELSTNRWKGRGGLKKQASVGMLWVCKQTKSRWTPPTGEAAQ